MPTCPHCGHEADASADGCPLCGTPLGEAASGAAGTTPAGAARTVSGGPTRAGATTGRGGGPAGAAEDPVPWEDPNLGFAAGVWRTWRESLFEPGRFFGRIREEGTVGRPLLYFLLVTVAASFFTLVWEAQGLTLGHLTGYVEMGGTMAAGPVISFVLTPIMALVLLLFLTMVFHLGALMVAPDRRGMGATARVVCYAAGPSVLAAVPIFGPAVGGIWGLVLQVVGLREAHRTTTLRAVFMVFWLWLAFVVLAILMAVLLAWVGGTGGGGTLVDVAAGPSGAIGGVGDAARSVASVLPGA